MRLAAAIADQGIAVDCDWRIELPELKLQRELRHYYNLRNGEPHAPHVWLWTNLQCLVATRRHARNDKFDEAGLKMLELGSPVVVRRSGGTVVPHGPGILNLSLFHVTNTAKIETGYQPLIELLINALNALGLKANCGSCPGSFCDGTYNLLVGGRKVAGTAAMLKRRGGLSYWLAHATIMVDADIEQAVGAVAKFEQHLGLRSNYQIERHTSLAEHLDNPGDQQNVPNPAEALAV